LITIAVQAQIESYERKSVSLFQMELAGETTRDQSRVVFRILQDKLESMGRFDINPIPLRQGVSLERVFEIAKEYAESKQLERAGEQFELMDEHYKEERITGETLDKIISGAYIIVPEIVGFSVSKDVEKETDKDGNESWKASVNVNYGLHLEVWNAENQGTFENPIWKPYLEDEATINATGSTTESFGSNKRAHSEAENMTNQAFKNSIFLLQFQMGKTLKTFDMFIIKAKVTQRDMNKDVIKFDFGKDVGLNKDDPFKVVYYEKDTKGNRKKVSLAYMKVRKVEARESRAQPLIIYNPDRIKENDLINPGDQVIEYPKLGLNISVRAGYVPYSLSAALDTAWMYYYDGNDAFYFQSDQDEISGSASMMFNLALDLAQFGAASEFYAVTDVSLLLNYPMFGGIGEIGFKKKFYKRRLGVFLGINAGAVLVGGKIGEVPEGEGGSTFMYSGAEQIPVGAAVHLTGWSLGLNFNGGLEVLLSPEFALTFEGGYRLYMPIEDEQWSIEARHEDETWKLEIDEFEVKPGPADVSGAWFSAGLNILL